MVRRVLPWLLLVLCWALPASAQTTPIPGAYAYTASPPLLLPFPAGAKVQVLAGYGPAMGSSLHADTDTTVKANDHYALDLIYADEANAGKGLPIVASLPGTVVRAGWATAGWANYGLRVILAHDLGDGHVYHTIYCHLDELAGGLEEGDVVAQGETIGTLGQSCQGAQSCGSFSTPHLHWALHRDSTIGGSGTGGSYGGNAVVPEPLDGAIDLLQGMTWSSTNTPDPQCGDGICSAGEEDACPEDCPTCTAWGAAGGIIEEDDPLCFQRGGNPSYWTSETAGHGGGLIHTLATDASTVDNFGVWTVKVQHPGTYELAVYTDTSIAQSQAARYVVSHADGDDEVIVDQSAVDGWRSLGAFAIDTAASVRLDDVTGEALSLDRRLVFDALRVIGLDVEVPGSGGAAGTGGSAGDGGAGATAGASVGAGPAASPELEPAEGCGCGVVGAPAGSGGLLTVLGLAVALGRRRRDDNC